MKRSAVAAIVSAAALQLQAQPPPQPPPSAASTGRAAIAGRVTDEFGDPAVNVVVTLEARTESAATRGAGLVQTDDRGEFRIGRLARGSYIVSVFRPETLTMNPIGPREPERTFYPDAPTAADAETIKLDTDETRDDIDFLIAAPKPMLPPVAAVRQQLALRGGLTSMPSGAAIVRGRVVTTSGSAVPRAQVRLMPADITQTRAAIADADGRFEFRDLAPGAVRLIAGKAGYSEVEAARTIDLKPEEARDGVELRLVRWSTMSGAVTDDRDEPVAGARVQLLRLRYDGGRRRLVPTGIPQQTNDLGRYRLFGVPPGQYVIRADRSRSQPWIEGAFGTLPVVVDGADVTDLVVQTSSGSSVSGRFTFAAHDNTKLPAQSAIELRPLPVDFDAAPTSVATANVHDDWTFEMSGLNGPRRLELTRVPPGWSLQEIRVRGSDVADPPLLFGRP